MARPRTELQTLLESLFGDETAHVYFQPPTNDEMHYPCILYKRDGSNNDRVFRYADNIAYRHAKRYQITVIDRNPDTDLPDKVEELPYCSIDRSYAAEGLNHYVFTLFF